ncbi:hypothetical protein CYMTET_44785 [Cymbomonas tetramitiformis]|uniref:Membrane transporter protein n=1 Tax=Cymbomonas tetramitiformis TaxID=36881 RepID=A0AAE0EZ98_9CHLO|nr:hypothetical protein CYMTET_44785 [Cymbomonas tetramitiformis]
MWQTCRQKYLHQAQKICSSSRSGRSLSSPLHLKRPSEAPNNHPGIANRKLRESRWDNVSPALRILFSKSFSNGVGKPRIEPSWFQNVKKVLPSSIPIGLLSGGLGSTVGIGGALIMVPLSIRCYGLRQIQANSTALLPNLATCISGIAVFQDAGLVDVPAGLLLVSAATATTPIGVRMAHRLSERAQKILFGSAMMAMGPLIYLKPHLASLNSGDDEMLPKAHEKEERGMAPLEPSGATMAETPRRNSSPDTSSRSDTSMMTIPSTQRCAFFMTLGGFVGWSAGVLGIGAGTLFTTGLAVAGGMSHKMVMGTSFVAILGPNIIGSWTHFRLGNLRTDLLPGLMLGSGVGSYVASHVAVDILPEHTLRSMFSMFVSALGMHTLYALRHIR